MMDLGWPKTVISTGGILVDKAGKANITDTQRGGDPNSALRKAHSRLEFSFTEALNVLPR